MLGVDQFAPLEQLKVRLEPFLVAADQVVRSAVFSIDRNLYTVDRAMFILLAIANGLSFSSLDSLPTSSGLIRGLRLS